MICIGHRISLEGKNPIQHTNAAQSNPTLSHFDALYYFLFDSFHFS